MDLEGTSTTAVREQLDHLVEIMLQRGAALNESLALGDDGASASARIAGELLRCNCIARALVAHVRRASHPAERDRCVSSMLALLAGAMVSDGALETIIADAASSAARGGPLGGLVRQPPVKEAAISSLR